MNAHALTRLACILVISISIPACDDGAAAREQAALQAQRLAQEAQALAKQKLLLEIKEMDIERSSLSQAALGHSSMISSLEQRLSEQTVELEHYTDEFKAFMMDHKMAILAVLAAGGGAAVALTNSAEFSDDAKSIGAIVGVLAGLYALANADEVAAVGDRILQATARTANMKSAIETTNQQLAAERIALEDSNAKLQQVNGRIAELRAGL
jgi:ADP-ribosylglycohydrolase